MVFLSPVFLKQNNSSMKNNLKTAKCTGFKYTVQWLLKNRDKQHHHPRKFLHASSQSVFTPAPQRQSLFWLCSPQMKFVFWGILYKWNHKIGTLFKTFCTWDSQYVSVLHSFSCLVMFQPVPQKLFIRFPFNGHLSCFQFGVKIKCY